MPSRSGNHECFYSVNKYLDVFDKNCLNKQMNFPKMLRELLRFEDENSTYQKTSYSTLNVEKFNF